LHLISGVFEGIKDGTVNFIVDEMVDTIQNYTYRKTGEKFSDVVDRNVVSFILEQYVKALGEATKCAIGSCSKKEN